MIVCERWHRCISWFAFLCAITVFIVSAFFIEQRIFNRASLARFLPSDTIFLLESQADLRTTFGLFSDLDYLTDRFYRDADVSSAYENFNGLLGELSGFAVYPNHIASSAADSLDPLADSSVRSDDNDLIQPGFTSVYVFDRLAVQDFSSSSDFYFLIRGGYVFVSRSSLSDLQHLDLSLRDTSEFVRIYNQMDKRSFVRGYLQLSSFMLELIQSGDDTMNLFRTFVFKEYLDDLGAVGLRLSLRDELLTLDVLNVFNSSLYESNEDSLLYSVEMANFVPDGDNILFYDGYGFGQKFETAFETTRNDAVFMNKLIEIYLKDFFEKTGIHLRDFISLLSGEYAVYYDFDDQYFQLSFESSDVDSAYDLFASAFDSSPTIFSDVDSVVKPVTLRDGTSGYWEVIPQSSLPLSEELNVGSFVINSLRRDGKSIFAFAQIDDVFLVSSDADRLQSHIKVMLSGDTLASHPSFSALQELLPFGSRDFFYLKHDSILPFSGMIIGKHIFADNMFLRLIAVK